MQLADSIVQAGSRVGGTAELQVGEGRQDAPVGTTVALIEQATKVMNEVHKRLCRAQGEEFRLLKELFKEDPEDFWRFNKKPSTDWTKEKFIKAVGDFDLVPAADPNTASHMQRVMAAQALYMMAKDDPASFNTQEVQKYVMKMSKIPNPARFLKTAPEGPPPDPKAQASMMSAQADLADSQNDAKELAFKVQNSAVEDQNRDKDRQSKVEIAKLGVLKEKLIHDAQVQHEAQSQAADHQHQAGLAAAGHQHDMNAKIMDASLSPPVPPSNPTE